MQEKKIALDGCKKASGGVYKLAKSLRRDKNNIKYERTTTE
jgi:hypothetical protein